MSGGLDSAAVAYAEAPDFALFVDYGQVPASGEREAARAIALLQGIELVEISVDCSALGSGSLAGLEAHKLAPVVEWWPFRNQLVITLAATKAIYLGVQELLLGTVRSDSTHADGTERFVVLMRDVLASQEGGIGLRAPAIHLTTEELVRRSKIPASHARVTHSCHRSPWACGICGGCLKRQAVLPSLGITI